MPIECIWGILYFYYEIICDYIIFYIISNTPYIPTNKINEEIRAIFLYLNFL